MENYEKISDFAFLGATDGYNKMIKYLSETAEKELWSFDSTDENSILKKYINGTFKQCYAQNKVLYSKNNDYACFNTGLLTPNGDDLIAFFEKNTRTDAQPWVLKGFKDKSDRQYMAHFQDSPELATYTDNFEEFYFNPDYNITINSDHILDDNWDRIRQLIPFPKTVVKTLLLGVIEEAKRKIKRNLRLVVPQYYCNRIMYLVPIQIPIGEEQYVTMALAVEKTESEQYRANTIFTKEMAYEKARLLMKPESNWLIEQ